MVSGLICVTRINSSGCFNGYIARRISKEPGSGLPMSSGLFSATGVQPGLRGWSTAVRRSISPSQPYREANEMTGQVKRILLAEDNANDVELTLEALAHHNL